ALVARGLLCLGRLPNRTCKSPFPSFSVSVISTEAAASRQRRCSAVERPCACGPGHLCLGRLPNRTCKSRLPCFFRLCHLDRSCSVASAALQRIGETLRALFARGLSRTAMAASAFLTSLLYLPVATHLQQNHRPIADSRRRPATIFL